MLGIGSEERRERRRRNERRKKLAHPATGGSSPSEFSPQLSTLPSTLSSSGLSPVTPRHHRTPRYLAPLAIPGATAEEEAAGRDERRREDTFTFPTRSPPRTLGLASGTTPHRLGIYVRPCGISSTGKTRQFVRKSPSWHARSTPLVAAYCAPLLSPAERTPYPLPLIGWTPPKCRGQPQLHTTPVTPQFHPTRPRSKTRAAMFREVWPSRSVQLRMQPRTTLTPPASRPRLHPQRFLLADSVELPQPRRDPAICALPRVPKRSLRPIQWPVSLLTLPAADDDSNNNRKGPNFDSKYRSSPDASARVESPLRHDPPCYAARKVSSVPFLF